MPTPAGQIKPARWAVTGGRIAPEWRWAWNGLNQAYLLWEGGGLTIRDVIDRGIVGTLDNMASSDWIAGKYGFSLVFDSANSEKIEFDKICDIGSSNTYAIVLGLKTTTTTAQTVWSQGLSTSTGPFMRLVVNRAASGDIQWEHRADSGASFAGFTGNNVGSNDGEWHQAIVSREGNDTWALYFDGVLINRATDSTPPDTTSLDRHCVASLCRTTAGTFFDGEVSHVFLYTRALTDSEALRLFIDPFGPFRMDRKTILAQKISVVPYYYHSLIGYRAA